MTIDDIALTLQRGLGLKGIAHLLAMLGDAASVYAASESELINEVGLRPEIVRGIVAKESHKQAAAEMKYLTKQGLLAVASTDPEYPELLRECPDSPHVLYVRGDLAALHGKMLSVVGTRAITPYGQRMCDSLVGRLGEIEPDTVIVSGLAYGVDANAHRAALKQGLRTVAVIASPLPDITPSQHRALADEIVEKGGAIVTELHSQTKQNGSYFIPRNRIIAGMSEGTVVVESPSGGGSLSTADLADGYSRVLMAVPGRVGDRSSEGTNRLVVTRRAAMVCSGDDIARELGWDIVEPGFVPAHKVAAPLLNADEKRVMNCFGEGETVEMDSLAIRSGVPVGQLAASLLSLELAGLLRPLPGKRYEKV